MNLLILILISGLQGIPVDKPSYQSYMIDKESMITYEAQRNVTEKMMEKQSIQSIEKLLKDAWSKTNN